MKGLPTRYFPVGKSALLIVILAAIVAISLTLRERLTLPAPVDISPLPVDIYTVNPERVELTRHYPGTIRDMDRAVISARIPSVVEQVSVREGAMINAGDELVRLDDQDIRAELQRVQAQVEQADADVVYFQKKIASDKRLFESNAISETVVDDSERRHKSALAALQQQQNNLALIQQKLEYTVITAHMDGRIQRLHVNPGELVGVGMPVIDLVGNTRFSVVATVPERDMNMIALGTELRVAMTDDKRWAGAVERIYPVMENRVGTLEADLPTDWVNLVNPGTAVDVEVVLQQLIDVLTVPSQAVFMRDNSFGVFIEQEGIARWRVVEVGASTGKVTVIHTGINEGERVIVTPYLSLEDGTAVTVSSEQ